MTEPQRKPATDVRVGSSTNGLAPVSVAERSLAAGLWQWGGLAAVALAAIAADQVTKHIVTRTLGLDESEHVIGPLSIHHVQNSGIAFGFFSSATAVVTVITGIAVVWMLVFFARSGARHPVLPAALGLLIGGSVSNLVDRIRLGHVTDFIDFRYWPAFNLADSFIVIGVAILLGRARRGRPHAPPASAAARRRRAMKLAVPAGAAGERLDRFLADAPRLAGGRRASGRRAARSSTESHGRRASGSKAGRRSSSQPRPRLRPSRRRRSPRSSGRTSTCSSSTSLRASSCTRVPGTRATRSSTHSPARSRAATTERPGVVHRLDRDTSGLMVVARSPEAYARLQQLVREHALERVYLALVRGSRARAPAGSRRRSAATGASRRACRSTPIRRARQSRSSRSSSLWPGHALLRVRLETGRMHQIRVHLGRSTCR